MQGCHTVADHAAAIDRICQWLDAWRHEAPAERVTLAELRTGRLVQDGPARLCIAERGAAPPLTQWRLNISSDQHTTILAVTH